VAISRCLSARPLLGALTAVAASAMLAACGGSQAQLNPQGPAQVNAETVAHPLAVEPDVCLTNGGVRVAPCRIHFTVAHPGPDSVSVRTPQGKKGSLLESDQCGGASGIATIVQGSGNTWTVTAGPTTGHCKARFNYFNNNQKVGWATLRINNSL
jgi:hypothetical protein